jgi:hypothetical protein
MFPLVFDLVPNGVCVVWIGLLKKPLEVVHGQPQWTLVTVSGGRDASHAGATCLPVMVVITAGHGRGPLKGLLAPLVATFDTLLGIVSGSGSPPCFPMLGKA